MKSKFGDNTVFLDIGAASGTMTVPYALSFAEGLRIVAFEPSRRARDYLEENSGAKWRAERDGSALCALGRGGGSLLHGAS